LRSIISLFPKDSLSAAKELFRNNKSVVFSGAGNTSSKAMLVSYLLSLPSAKTGALWITSDSSEYNLLQKSLEIWGDKNVYSFKKRNNDEMSNFGTYSYFQRIITLEKLAFVYGLKLDKQAVFLINVDSLKEYLPTFSKLEKRKIKIRKGEDYELVKFINQLVEQGYEVADDENLEMGQYIKKGDSIYVYPVNKHKIYRVDFDFGSVDDISEGLELEIYPANYRDEEDDILDLYEGMIIDDEVDVIDEDYKFWNDFMLDAADRGRTLSFSTFNDDVKNHLHLHFLSVLKYRTGYDFANSLRDLINAGWKTIFFTKNLEEIRALLADQKVPFKVGIDDKKIKTSSVFLIEVDKEDVFPVAFQAPYQKISIMTDHEVAFLKDNKRKNNNNQNIFNDFLTSLKAGDYVVHADHGIAKFLGLEKKTVDKITKEYLKLGYAQNDKLFVPIDQADKVNKYIGSEEMMPRLTRLGSAEWNTLTNKVRKETQKIAKELLKLYAERKAAKGHKFNQDNKLMEKFEATFPYEETPGQIKAINDVKSDMERPDPMDRLICGDVGFGKTEVAMRAAFKAFISGKQVAVVSPITILADQHYRSFKKRMTEFNVRIEMLSRFRTQGQQKKILEKLKKGELDIVVGTHRLLQKDVGFKNLGLVIIDEEQRFGVKQKEALKELRKEVDILTLTATPIPRTLNICLNNLRDITTITTPPYGRLPVITEVRKYSSNLLREAVLKEIQRGGQAYILHNRVQTIDSFAAQLQELIPEARFGVAHGKLGAGDLEERILAFKKHEYDVLVSSTIIENGIDLANANTLIVNNAERFGLSQLYQLRGRVGRGKQQAYAYFLYHGQRLKLDAKKRLRAIVEASDLGSGFQIAMKDLEIRGAGDILGANQHGVINVVGMAHFMRMLNKAVEDLKSGRGLDEDEEIKEVSIDLPLQAYIPDTYISNSKDKINAYQQLSGADSISYLEEIRAEFIEDYGRIPEEVSNLFDVIELKILAKNAGVNSIKSEPISMSVDRNIVLTLGKRVKPANIVNLLEFHSAWQIVGSRMKIQRSNLSGAGSVKSKAAARSNSKLVASSAGKKTVSAVNKPSYDWIEGLKKSLTHLAEKAKHGGKAKKA
jgi:transcription-repair coupling factor